MPLRPGFSIVRYLGRLPFARTVLWCYLVWYLVVVARHFEATPRLWLTSIGLSLIVGWALLLNATSNLPSDHSLLDWVRRNRWAAFRFFVAPFCVSSFSALVKGKGFTLVFSPDAREVAVGVCACAGFLTLKGLSALWLGLRPRSTAD